MDEGWSHASRRTHHGPSELRLALSPTAQRSRSAAPAKLATAAVAVLGNVGNALGAVALDVVVV